MWVGLEFVPSVVLCIKWLEKGYAVPLEPWLSPQILSRKRVAIPFGRHLSFVFSEGQMVLGFVNVTKNCSEVDRLCFFRWLLTTVPCYKSRHRSSLCRRDFITRPVTTWSRSQICRHFRAASFYFTFFVQWFIFCRTCWTATVLNTPNYTDENVVETVVIFMYIFIFWYCSMSLEVNRHTMRYTGSISMVLQLQLVSDVRRSQHRPLGWWLAWRSGSSVRHLHQVKLCRAWLVLGFDGILIRFGEHLAWPSLSGWVE